jgi:hypothetical protein
VNTTSCRGGEPGFTFSAPYSFARHRSAMFTTGARPVDPIVDHAACSNEREWFKRAYIEGYPARIQTPIG